MKLLIPMAVCCGMFSLSCMPDLLPFQWLIGTWEMPKSNGSVMLETWQVKDSKSLTGLGLKVTGRDTTLLETISLYYDKGDVWYAPAVTNQNYGLAVPFKLVDSKTNQYTFENPEHDFPQRIVYEFKPVNKVEPFAVSLGDTIAVAVTDLLGEGIHFRFIRKQLK